MSENGKKKKDAPHNILQHKATDKIPKYNIFYVVRPKKKSVTSQI